MALYFFDLRDSWGLHRDEVGIELTGIEEVRQQMRRLLPDMACEQRPGSDLHEISCDVRDEVGRSVYRGVITYRATLL